jgi:superfamily II DNA or RNA helicase
MQFEIGNTWTHVIGGDPQFIHALDMALRYPTQIARAKEAGFVPPEEMAWDGWKRLLRQSKLNPPKLPTGLLGRAQNLAQNMGYEVELKDGRERPLEDVPDREAIPLRDYQEMAVSEALRAGRGVLDMPPRSGKTRTMCELHRSLSLKTVWIAPTDRIVKQTVATLEGFFGKHYVTHLVGSKADNVNQAANCRVVCCTAATAGALPAEFYQSREMLVVDEWHHGASKTYQRIFDLCDHIYFRFGMTGTFFRSGEDEMAMHALLSHTIFKVDAKDLEERGYLVPTNVVFVPVDGRVPKPPPRYDAEGNVKEETFQTRYARPGVWDHERRNQLVTMSAILLQQTGRKVLVLVAAKTQGRLLKEMIGAYLPRKAKGAQYDKVEFISTDIQRDTQTRMIDAFLESEEINVLIGTSILGEGVDLPVADALVYARGEKAEVSLTQNAYRVCTQFGSKTDAIVVDFADRHHKKLLAHSKERLDVYHSIPIFDVTVLQSMNDFVDWLKGTQSDKTQSVHASKSARSA